MKTPPEPTANERVIGCIRGKAIGGTLGAPPEGRMELLDLTYYDPVPTGILPNDDFDIQLLFLESVESAGGRVDSRILAKTWSERMMFPFDEYGVASLNLKRGLLPPVTGWFDNPFKNCMGSPIRSELWALLAPGRPRLAAYFAMQDSMIDHAEESIAGEMFFSALESIAFSGETDFIKLIASACEVIDPSTQTAKAIQFCISNYSKMDWKALRTEVIREFGHPNFTEAPQNIAFTLFGLLYFSDDFEKALLCTTNCGYDTDCTAATLGAIWGIVNGDRFPERWVTPIGNNMLASHGVYDMAMPGDLGELAQHIGRVRDLVAEHYKFVSEEDASDWVAAQLRDLSTFKPVADTELTLTGTPLLEETTTLVASRPLRSASVRYPFKATVEDSTVTLTSCQSDYLPSTARVTLEEMDGRLHTVGLVTPHELWKAEGLNQADLLAMAKSPDHTNFRSATLPHRTFLLKDMSKSPWLLLSGYVHFNVTDIYCLEVFAECPVTAWLDGELIQNNPKGEPCIPAPHRFPADRVKGIELTPGWKRWDILLNSHETVREGKVCITIAQTYTKALVDYRFRRSPSGVYNH